MNYAAVKETSSTASGSYAGIKINWDVTHLVERGPATIFYMPTQESALNARFRELAKRWKDETLDMSSLSDIITHPAYLQIIAMGRKALPLLLDQLRNEPDHWFAALSAISNHNPVPPQQAGNLDQMTEAWLAWAEQSEM